MGLKRGRKPQELDFEAEYREHVEQLHSQIGQPVPLSCSYTRGQPATLVSIDGETATIRFRNGAELTKVPLRDLVNDVGYWK